MKNALTLILIRYLVGFCLIFSIAGNAVAATINEVAKLLPSDLASWEYFGWSVAVDGDTAVIGAIGGDSTGTAYVFVHTAGVWIEQQKLTATDSSSGDNFGWSVAVDGDTVVIGAPRADDVGISSGSAYIFTRTADMWMQQQKLTAGDADEGALFGWSVAIDGDSAVIGSPADDNMVTRPGSAYVFNQSTGVWSQQQKLTASDSASGDNFGWSVDVDRDSLAIGTHPQFSSGGPAYVFTRSADLWIQQQKLTISDNDGCPYFNMADYEGASVAIDGDTLIVGRNTDHEIDCYSGAAYVFTRSAGVWTQQQKLTASDADGGERFGYSVALDGNTAVISAPQDDEMNWNSGSAYVFTRTAGAWSESHKLLASDGVSYDTLGEAVAVSGSTVVAGAINYNDGVYRNAGKAYVFSDGPIVSNVVANPNPLPPYTPLVITANVDDTANGGSTIANANCTIDGGIARPMSPLDGNFDQTMEDVSTTLKGGAPAGIYNICVTGTDSAGNTGMESCTSVYVMPTPPINLWLTP
ncbi:MAG: FG-GAP repeat protein [Lysobacterales bacterium]